LKINQNRKTISPMWYGERLIVLHTKAIRINSNPILAIFYVRFSHFIIIGIL